MYSAETLVRLTHFEIDAIKQSAIEVFGASVQVILFGSRVEPLKKVEISIYIFKLTQTKVFYRKLNSCLRLRKK
jgi:hypothetical protein